LRAEDDILRMKAPSTLTMRWLLARLSRFRHLQAGNEVQLTSAWMDIDHVDFNQEPFDCAVLLSNGHFPPDWEATLAVSRNADPGGRAQPAGRTALGRQSGWRAPNCCTPRQTVVTGGAGSIAWA
jgi:LysR family transcriptional regulator, glycine cleavage system transcriptional activator